MEPHVFGGEIFEPTGSRPFVLEEVNLSGRPTQGVVADVTVRSHHPVARDHKGNRVAANGRSDRAGRARSADMGRDAGIGGGPAER